MKQLQSEGLVLLADFKGRAKGLRWANYCIEDEEWKEALGQVFTNEEYLRGLVRLKFGEESSEELSIG